MTYISKKFEGAMLKGYGGDAFTMTGTVAQYPLYHVPYAPVKFDVKTSNRQRDAFKRNFDL